MIHGELVVERLMQDNNQRSSLIVFVQNCEFHPLILKEASNVSRSVQRHGTRRSEVIYHAEAHWLPRGKVLEWVFQLR